MSNPFKVGDQVSVESGMSKKLIGLTGEVMYIDGEFCEVALEGRKDYDRLHYLTLSLERPYIKVSGLILKGCDSCGVKTQYSELTEDNLCPECDLKRGAETLKSCQENDVDFQTKEQVKPEKAKRYNSGKPELSYNLYCSDVNELEASIWAKGAEKYEAGNWQKGQSLVKGIDSLQRHVTALLNGEDLDKETGLPHVGHMITCAKIIARAYLKGGEFDDRVK